MRRGRRSRRRCRFWFLTRSPLVAAFMAAVTSLMTMGAPPLPPLHPVGPGGLSGRGGRGSGGLLCFGLRRLQRRRQCEAQYRPEAKQGKRLSARNVFTHYPPPCFEALWLRSPIKNHFVARGAEWTSPNVPRYRRPESSTLRDWVRNPDLGGRDSQLIPLNPNQYSTETIVAAARGVVSDVGFLATSIATSPPSLDRNRNAQ